MNAAGIPVSGSVVSGRITALATALAVASVGSRGVDRTCR